jgi:hypothetical protein
MRIVAALLLMLPLAACAGTDNSALSANASVASAGKWRIEPRVDRISGGTAPSSILETVARNTHSVDPHVGVVQLMCFDKKPIIRVAFNIKVGANNTAILEYRFDEKPGRKANGEFLSDHTIFLIDEKADVAKFLDELATSTVLFVRVSSLALGRTTAEFRVTGAPVAIESVYAQCPVSPQQRRKSA